jgi:Tol biopolymer transport system component
MLTFPPTGWPDLYQAFSPDNKSLAFVRSVNASVQELYVVSLAGGKPARLPTQGQRIYGVAWTPDGRDLVYSSGEGDWANADLFRVSVSGKSPPRPITGGERAWLPAIPLRGGRLGFTRQLSETNIWRVRTGTDVHQPASAVRVIASTQADSAPAFSPDGRRIAFNSDRSGGGQLWVCDRDGADATQMTFFPEGSRAGQGAWSPDGSQIAFTAQVLGNRDIYLISLSGGTPRRLTSDSSLDYAPSWSRDGKWVYFASDRTGRREVWKIAVQGGSSTQVTRHGGQRPVESPDGKYVYYEKGPTSLHEFEPWRVPVNGGEEERVRHDLGSRWTLARDGFYYYEQAHGGDLAGTWFLKFIEVARRADHVVAQLPGMPLIGHRPAVSPDRRTLLYAQVDLNETDMMLMENFR